jgi:hypothetical protein
LGVGPGWFHLGLVGLFGLTASRRNNDFSAIVSTRYNARTGGLPGLASRVGSLRVAAGAALGANLVSRSIKEQPAFEPAFFVSSPPPPTSSRPSAASGRTPPMSICASRDVVRKTTRIHIAYKLRTDALPREHCRTMVQHCPAGRRPRGINPTPNKPCRPAAKRGAGGVS